MRPIRSHNMDMPDPRPARRWWKISGTSHATVVAYMALFMAMSGTAVAATGGSFILGKSNSADTVSTLTSSSGSPLSLRSPAGSAPLRVNRSVKVERLNADLLDGIDSTGLVQAGKTNVGARTTLSNPDGVPLRLTPKAGSPPLQVGTAVKVANLNADLLDGKDSSEFVPKAAFDALQADHAALAAQVAQLQHLLEGVSRVKVDGHDTVRFSDVNVQVVNGTGTTTVTNGRGNLIIGYNAVPVTGATQRTGSHYLVIGDEHHWTSYGGIVTGLGNTATGSFASVLGGSGNTAGGLGAAVTGGQSNKAIGDHSTVSGGRANTASGPANPQWWVGDFTAVVGGHGNTATGVDSTILGGYQHKVTTDGACAPACS
jgi:hypothetical protein